MKNVKELARLEGITLRSFRRRIEKDYQKLKEVNGGDFRFFSGDTLSKEVIEALLSPEALKKALNGSAPPPEEPAPSGKPKKAAQGSMAARPEVKKKVRAKDISEALPRLAAFIIVLGDGVAAAYMVLKSYNELKIPAAILFFLIGAAVGYAAIRNIMKYEGIQEDAWAVGFAVWQIALHLSALGVFEGVPENTDLSFFIGKIVIAVGIGLATPGLAVTMKNQRK
jgi:hypothetical protein